MLKYGFNFAVAVQDNNGMLQDIYMLNGYETLIEELWNCDNLKQVESAVNYYNVMKHETLIVFPLD